MRAVAPALAQVATETNQALLSVAPHPERGWEAVDVPAILGALQRELRTSAEPGRHEALLWVHVLLLRAQDQVRVGKGGGGGTGGGGECEVGADRGEGEREGQGTGAGTS
eukprot:357286-Chlamydomonas_euryale.AAC.4